MPTVIAGLTSEGSTKVLPFYGICFFFKIGIICVKLRVETKERVIIREGKLLNEENRIYWRGDHGEIHGKKFDEVGL